MPTLDKLANLFRQFPGIGPRQAKRFVHFLLSRDAAFLSDLVKLISVLKEETAECRECFRFFERGRAAKGIAAREGVVCRPCADPNRAVGELMVVLKDADLDAMEKSGTYYGRYFVLGGIIALPDEKFTSTPRLKELEHRVKRDTKSGMLREVILALSANPDGEHTSSELKRLLAAFPVKVSALGRGLSTGSELEYADKDTLASALKNRSVLP